MKNNIGEHKYYIVSSMEAPYEEFEKTMKTFRYRKPAERYGVKLVERYGHCEIATWINCNQVKTERY